MNKFWKIINKTKESAEILIYEQIGKDIWSDEGIAAKDFASDLKALGDIKDIILRLNSPGGSVFEGIVIYNLLKAHTARVIVYVDGIAASIASVIAMSGDRIIMPENTMMMIHDPTGFVMGAAVDMRKMADTLDKIKESIKTAYKRTMLTDEEIDKMMSDETWMTAADAIEKGFADEVIEAVKIAAQFDFKGLGFKKPPMAVMNIKQKEVSAMTKEQIQAQHPEVYNAIVDEGKTIGIDSMKDAIIAAKAEGTETERKRILSVKDQLIPGHEELINSLMFDGITTGEQAAIKILSAERELRNKRLDDFRADGAKTTVTDGSDAQTITMKRAEFNALSPEKQRELVKSAVKVVD